MDLLQAFQRQQASITGACAYQHHFALFFRPIGEQLFNLLVGLRGIAVGQGLRQSVVYEQPFPEAATSANAAKLLLHPLAQ
ncbi:hypothetical protein D3C77_611240 [compost metagenome]